MPVVIYLHGGGGSISAAYEDKMDQSADALGFILVIPAGTGNIPNHLLVWNVEKWGNDGCCGYAFKTQIDDVGFVSKVIDDVKARFTVDDKRIYATGISNGGVFSYLLGCKLPGKIAAIAPVAPPAVPDACSSSRPISIVHVHGTGDLFAKYNGGMGGTLFIGLPGACFDLNAGNSRRSCTVQPAEQQVDYWVKKDQCSPIPSRAYQKGAATCFRYNSCAGGQRLSSVKSKAAVMLGPVATNMHPSAK